MESGPSAAAGPAGPPKPVEAAAELRSSLDATRVEVLLRAGNAEQAIREYGTGIHGSFAGPPSHAQRQQEIINQPPGTHLVVSAPHADDGRLDTQLGTFHTVTIAEP